ncbi:DUF6319 family protein [Amycolatopsis taiwanensis]|uniref:Mucin n=1 Tax=Amycolatopsis taiwanensis TaxID=342230 RepID=A0A9W6R6R1_9PSEU|nr:DUF6319 family protein [Amycolatopsis taiwanensis]GLY68627.1 hypothetical protein Atai01_52460 [Amycolatopsis taiwanensis]
MSLDTTTASPETAETEAAPADAEKSAETTQPKRGRAKGATARKTRTVELTLTVTGTADGDWQAELKHGSTWVARGLAVSSSAVSRAAKELHTDLSTPIDEVINAAREQQKAKVAALEAELEQAKQALAELDS